MIYLIYSVLCLNGSPSEDSFSNDSKCIWNVDIDPGNAAYSAHQIFMLELSPPPPFFLVGREKAKCWSPFDHCGTIFFFLQWKESSFILYPSLGCCPRVGDDHKREAKKPDSFGCITFYSCAKLCTGNGHRMLGPATRGPKNATTIPFSLSNKIFPELPSWLSHYQRCLDLCHMIKAILAVSRVLYLLLGVALPPTFFE